MTRVANPASALGEAIGTLLEKEIHHIFRPLAEAHGYIYVTTGLGNKGTKQTAKLLLEDDDGNKYNIDAVIINRRFQPLVLIESKYIRYKKHNRDKASWICAAHSRLRQRYSTVRQSIAILMGNWSKPSKHLLESFDVSLFEVSFDDICNVLSEFGIDYRWAEKDRQKAQQSWMLFSSLPDNEKQKIGRRLIEKIREPLSQELSRVLDDSKPRKVKSVTLTVHSTYGETRVFSFTDLPSAIHFLKTKQEEEVVDIALAPSLIDGRTDPHTD